MCGVGCGMCVCVVFMVCVCMCVWCVCVCVCVCVKYVELYVKIYFEWYMTGKVSAVAQWLRYCATNWKVAGSIPDGVVGIFH